MRRFLKLPVIRWTLAMLVALSLGQAATAQETRTLYRATLLQAAPGRLLELIEVCKAKGRAEERAGDQASLVIRHSQGDKWDLLLLTPMESYDQYYQAGRMLAREASGGAERALTKFSPLVAWREDVLVYGPRYDEVQKAFAAGTFFHVEMMEALPGMLSSLRREREMENVYHKELKRPENFIFVRDQGAAWDIFTIGVYRDLKHYAESVDIPIKQQEEAAKKAGFESASAIGPYLRTFIRSHHDTLAVAVKEKEPGAK
jgi:hypothetical protein